MRNDIKGEMRIAVFADTHGNSKGVRDALDRNAPFDALVHLGDGVDDGVCVAAGKGIPFYGVSGNEDHASELPSKRLLVGETVSIMLVHGHQTDINPYQDQDTKDVHYHTLAGIAHNAGAGTLMFGHTHEPMIKLVDDVMLFNPGEMYLGSSSGPTFGILEILDGFMSLSILRLSPGHGWESINSLLIGSHESNGVGSP